jgi:hypothetical protein
MIGARASAPCMRPRRLPRASSGRRWASAIRRATSRTRSSSVRANGARSSIAGAAVSAAAR